MSATQTGRVYLVGAGPGDPELLTLRAARLLNEADVVLHDDLVPASILSRAGKQTLVISVGKRCGRKKITQAAIHELMIASAGKGLKVVRLKSGDPMIFGRAGEEIDALREAQVPFEIVPGVTAASSAAALLEASLTDRRSASKLILLSGHHAAREIRDESLWTGALPQDATLAIYMPGRNLSGIAESLLRNGAEAGLPCIVISDASRPEARYSACRLNQLGQIDAPLAPALLLAGHVFESVLEREGETIEACLGPLADLLPAFRQG